MSDHVTFFVEGPWPLTATPVSPYAYLEVPIQSPIHAYTSNKWRLNCPLSVERRPHGAGTNTVGNVRAGKSANVKARQLSAGGVQQTLLVLGATALRRTAQERT